MDGTAEPFGVWLKAKRQERGLSLRDVERITEGRISNALLSQIESGRVKSSGVVTLHQISAALALDFAEVCARACVGEAIPASPSICETCGQTIRNR